MKAGIRVILLVCVASLAHSQELTEIPKNTAVLSGQDARFNCSVSNLGDKNLSWKERVSSPIGVLVYRTGMAAPNDPEDYAINREIQDHYDLIVKSADVLEAGWYSCALTDGEENVAYLIVVETPVVIENAIEYEEGNVYNLGCSVKFGAPGLGIEPEDLPVLRASIGNRVVGESKFEKAVGEVGQSASSQSMYFNFTALPEHDQEYVNCTVLIDSVMFSTNASYQLDVKHATTSVAVVKPQNKYRVGDKIKCEGNGNPAPSYTWTPVDVPEGPENMQAVKGDTLTILEGMVGKNEWKCEAWNNNEDDMVEASITFDAVYDPYGNGAERVWSVNLSLMVAAVALFYMG